MIHRLIMASSITQIGGYDYEFVDTNLPDEFQCPICTLVPRDVHQANCCGKMFCKSCLDELKRTSTNYTCPNCREDLTNNHFFKDVNTNRKIRHLLIHCSNKRCQWKGSLRDIDNHLSTCAFQIVECSNTCGEQLIRIVLNSHLLTKCPKRVVSCVYCHKKNEYQIINGDHYDICTDIPLYCPNNDCEEKIKRCLMTQHRTVCLYEMVRCSNRCGFECKRNELYKHLHNTCPKRIVSCPLCQSKAEHRSITGVHLTQCPDYPLPCANNGCEGKIKQCLMTEHRTVCLYEMVRCSNRCGFECKRNELYKHLHNTCPKRIVSCPLCQSKAEHRSITGVHLTQCPDYPIPCPNNGCEKKTKRCLMTQHRYTCPKEEVDCQYMYSYMLYECKQKINRENIHPHMIQHYKNEITLLRRINLVVTLMLVAVLLLSLQIPTILLIICFTLLAILLYFNY